MTEKKTRMFLETQGLNKVFLGCEILKNCDLHVETSTIYGLLGANGAGSCDRAYQTDSRAD